MAAQIIPHFNPSEKVTPSILHQFTPSPPPLAAQLLLHFTLSEEATLTLTPFYPPWKPNAAQKDLRVLSCIFLKNPPIADPLLHHFTPPPWQPNSYIILPPQSYIFLAPIPEDCQS